MAPMSGCYGYDLQGACSSKRESIPMRMHMHKTAAVFFFPRGCILLLKCEVSSNTKNKGKVLLVYNIFCNTIGHETRNINLISITKLTINKRNKEIRETEVYRNIYYCTNRINCY